MKRTLIAVLSLSTAMVLASTANAAVLKNDKDKLSYTIGVDLGNNFKRQGIDVNAYILAKGLQDSAQGKKLLLTKEEMQQTLKTFQTNLMKKKQAEYKSAADKNKKAGEAFLAANKTKNGVVTLDNGLQYRIIKAGTGKKPGPNDSVTVKYTGRLINNTVFDSTDKTGKPVTFRVKEVIPGWTQALQLMKEGATWEIFVPSNLAYGPRGVGGPIGPNETLIFNIELISVKSSS